MVIEDQDPLEGLFEKLHSLVLNELLGNVPSSLVAIGAVRRTNPELAKRIFVEGFLAPSRALLADSASALLYLEELESRFRQDEMIAIYRDWETLVMADLIRSGYQGLIAETEERVLDENRELTSMGKMFFNSLVDKVQERLSLIVVSCERLVLLLLAASIAGEEAVAAEIEVHRTAIRPSLLHNIESWLLGNGYDQDTPGLIAQMERIASASDARVMRTYRMLLGCYFWPRSAIEQRLNAILGVAEEIEF